MTSISFPEFISSPRLPDEIKVLICEKLTETDTGEIGLRRGARFPYIYSKTSAISIGPDDCSILRQICEKIGAVDTIKYVLQRNRICMEDNDMAYLLDDDRSITFTTEVPGLQAVLIEQNSVRTHIRSMEIRSNDLNFDFVDVGRRLPSSMLFDNVVPLLDTLTQLTDLIIRVHDDRGQGGTKRLNSVERLVRWSMSRAQGGLWHVPGQPRALEYFEVLIRHVWKDDDKFVEESDYCNCNYDILKAEEVDGKIVFDGPW